MNIILKRSLTILIILGLILTPGSFFAPDNAYAASPPDSVAYTGFCRSFSTPGDLSDHVDDGTPARLYPSKINRILAESRCF